jgi:SIR2-like domain
MTPSDYLPQRLFFLGAGFSRLAGLPLAPELLPLALCEIEGFQTDSHLHAAVAEYQEFVAALTATAPNLAQIDVEEFITYLDHEHYFGFLGSDTFSAEGNRPQLLLRWAIGRLLHRTTPATLPDLYLRFAERLRGGDIVATFNYDLILERALEAAGIPYRRFPHRFSEVYPSHSVVEIAREMAEVALLKLHGSLDWLNRGRYRDLLAYVRSVSGEEGERLARDQDPVFGTSPTVTTHPLVEGPRPENDPLAQIVVIDSPDVYYNDYSMWWRYAPVLLAPSHAKQLYGEALRGFWEGLPLGGALWGGFSIVGCSLPPADPYTKQALYRIGRSFAYGREHPEERFGPMNRIKVVNRAAGAATDELRKRYRFLPQDHTDFLLDGLDEAALDEMFRREG